MVTENDRYIMEYKGNQDNYTIYYQDWETSNYKEYSKIGWLSKDGKINLSEDENLWEELKQLSLTKEIIKRDLENIT